ncbi:hypothetical protein [Paenibacillus sp. HB172176]|uniref:hypothetical protein n=1 Tax=Paenibacillus sp. HB172176 TaxID=2493690 RepID=UPI001438FDCA|nr:hypothetical protein [Paenibacillus sp. HB172176]
MAAQDLRYIPFSWDELDKKPELCRSSVYEILGRYNQLGEELKLSAYERVLLNQAWLLGEPFKLSNVMGWLGKGRYVCGRAIKSLKEKEWVLPVQRDRRRVHYYIVHKEKVKQLKQN